MKKLLRSINLRQLTWTIVIMLLLALIFRICFPIPLFDVRIDPEDITTIWLRNTENGDELYVEDRETIEWMVETLNDFKYITRMPQIIFAGGGNPAYNMVLYHGSTQVISIGIGGGGIRDRSGEMSMLYRSYRNDFKELVKYANEHAIDNYQGPRP